MAKLADLQAQRHAARTKAQALVDAALNAGTDLGGKELAEYNKLVVELSGISAAIDDHAARSSIVMPHGTPGMGFGPFPVPESVGSRAPRGQQPMPEEYNEAFLAFLRSGGKQASRELTAGFDPMFGGFALPAFPRIRAALYEGSNSAGGYSVSVPTDDQIVPLGLPDLGVRSVAKVIETETDIKIPTQSTFGQAGIKAESGASTNTFSESDPTLSQFTLSAFMTGLTHTASWELLADVRLFQEFCVKDLLNAIAVAEDAFFISGTGTNQPQGLIGNVGTGTGSPVPYESTGAYLLSSTLDVVGTLKASYFPNAAWLMSRATATAIRKAQQQSNLFAPVWTRENGRDYLHGFPVSYSQTMPSLPTSTTAGVTPILFGSFQDGYVIGDRGGSGTFVKILDQPLATSGQTILLGYKRVDGRVRRSEAIQQISVSHS